MRCLSGERYVSRCGDIWADKPDPPRGRVDPDHAPQDVLTLLSQRARIESAVRTVLSAGLRTADIWSEGTTKVGTRAMGDAVVAALTTTKTIAKS